MSADYAGLIARGVVYVLRDSGTGGIRGVLVMMPEDGAMFIENVAVDPRHQGQGLGRILLEFAECQVRPMHCGRCDSTRTS